MDIIEIKKLGVVLGKHLIPWWWRVAYKIPAPTGDKWKDVINMKMDDHFNEVVTGYIKDCFADKKLPADIETTIYNLSNDLMNGRELTIRTGDYIALQNHIKQKKQQGK
jgi:hypothetical protein